MKIRTTFALAAATLTLGVPVAAAAPDGSQPQLRSGAQPDAIDRYLANNGPDGSQPQLRSGAQPDAIDRYMANNGPDGFQPQLQTSIPPDAIDRYVANNGPDGFQPQLQTSTPPDAIDRYLRNHSTGSSVAVDLTEAGGVSWQTGALATFGGALIVLLAVVGASAMRERRRLILR